jgi:precorrin-6Y C5,15-methyltransferase (decarboxylating)
MKKVAVIGTGLGADTLTAEAREAVLCAEVLLGASRMLEPFQNLGKPTYPCYLPEDVTSVIEKEDAQEFAVLVSGDVGFFSAAAGYATALAAYDLRFIPGISTVNAFFAKLKQPWQDAAFISTHGRDWNAVEPVRRNRMTFCLTGNNVREIGAALSGAGLGYVKTYTGENLGSEQERVYETIAADLRECPPLTVLLFMNEQFDDRTPAGLPDSRFIRLAGIPMTKSETRAVALSKLNLRQTDICWDVGAGTGSVTAEMALHACRGRVYAIERKPEAIPLIERNLAAFHIGNATVLCGEAPAALETLPTPDAVFIGGSGGGMDEIAAAVLRKNVNARIVVTAVTLETVSAALAAFKKAELEPEIVQLSAARGKRAGKLHMMEAQNPVTILCAGGRV